MDTNYCKEHGTLWFKKGQMKSYAHPIKEGKITIGWCNKPTDEAPSLVKEVIKEGAKIVETAPKALVEQEIEEERATRELAKRQGDAKNRAFALSYAKDLAVAAQSTIGKELSSDNIIALAKKFAKYLDTGE